MAPCHSPSIPSVCSLHSCPDIPKSISDDPRIQALLKCNDPPLEAERFSLLATESSSLELLSVLKKEIDNVQQMLKTLLDGQAKVTGNLLTAKALLHPIRSVPDDVLSYIFSFCVHEVYDLLNDNAVHNSLDLRKPPWTLSQVCRSWRSVSLSTASLWKCISIGFGQYPELKDVHLHQFMLGLHIQRARQCQLTIRLSSRNDVSSHALMPILLTSIPYWKHLRAYIPAKSLAMLSTYGGYLQSLHYLFMRLPDNANAPIHTFEMAQSLRILEIRSTLCGHFCLPDSGHGLTELRISGPFHKHVFPFLCKTPNIETLRLHFEASEPFERLNSPIIMSKLTTLEMSEWDGAAPSSIAHFFESLELPALSNMCFDLDNEDSDSTVFVFPEILPHHRCCKLRRLEVTASRSKIGKTGLIDLLTRATNLEYLAVSAKVVEKDLLSALTRSNDNDDILPELRTLNLRGSESISDHKLLLQMVESRTDQTEDDERDEEEDDSEKMKDEIEDDGGDTEDEGDDEDDKKAKDETEDVEENNEGADQEDNQDADEEQEGVMLEWVYLDESLTFDDPALAARWEAFTLKSDGFIVDY